MDDIKRWSTQELSDYIRLFDTAEARENVVKELMAAKILNDFLGTTHGRLLLNSTIDGIRSNMMKIVRLSIEGIDPNREKITQAALQINVAYDFMHGIATTLTRGEEHETKMRK